MSGYVAMAKPLSVHNDNDNELSAVNVFISVGVPRFDGRAFLDRRVPFSLLCTCYIPRVMP